MAVDATLDLHAPDRAAVPASTRVRFYNDFRALPPSYDALFARAAEQSVCLTRSWFEILAETILGPGERPCLAGVEADADGPNAAAQALLVGRHRERDPEFAGARSFSGLSACYSLTFAPLLAADTDSARALATLTGALRAQRPRYDVLRFQPLERASPPFDALARALRGAGFVVQPYFHLGNWFEPCAGRSAADYLAARPGALRNTLRRKSERLSRAGAELEVVTGGPALARGLADYERVFARSWKDPEPHPQVVRRLAQACAGEGALRLGLLRLDGAPIAAQIWIVWRGTATLYKLAHHRRHGRLSPGTVLTARMIEQILDKDRPAALDFGVGDDRYKADWTKQRREHWGIIAFNPRTLHGQLGICRHIWGRAVKRRVFGRAYKPEAATSAKFA